MKVTKIGILLFWKPNFFILLELLLQFLCYITIFIRIFIRFWKDIHFCNLQVEEGWGVLLRQQPISSWCFDCRVCNIGLWNCLCCSSLWSECVPTNTHESCSNHYYYIKTEWARKFKCLDVLHYSVVVIYNIIRENFELSRSSIQWWNLFYLNFVHIELRLQN